MKLVVGLGNPGRKYEGTRHNVGFVVLDELARRAGAPAAKSGVDARTVVESNWARTKTLLVWPQTYMNLSGSAVLRLRDFYKLSNEDLLVVCDDFHLPLGRLRLRGGGSAGGQKGLDDIIRRLIERPNRPLSGRHRHTAGRLRRGRFRAQQVSQGGDRRNRLGRPTGGRCGDRLGRARTWLTP